MLIQRSSPTASSRTDMARTSSSAVRGMRESNAVFAEVRFRFDGVPFGLNPVYDCTPRRRPR
jgi:hypothetical protein